jgi:hypothetical protein
MQQLASPGLDRLGAEHSRRLLMARSRSELLPRKSLISIVERGSGHPSTTGGGVLFNGHFHLLLDAVAKDSGTTVIRPNVGAITMVAGQSQAPVTGSDNLTSKRGTLSISFQGVVINVRDFSGGDDFSNEYGTWKISGGSGIYKGWKGGGRWALVGSSSVNNIEWDGSVTH